MQLKWPGRWESLTSGCQRGKGMRSISQCVWVSPLASLRVHGKCTKYHHTTQGLVEWTSITRNEGDSCHWDPLNKCRLHPRKLTVSTNKPSLLQLLGQSLTSKQLIPNFMVPHVGITRHTRFSSGGLPAAMEGIIPRGIPVTPNLLTVIHPSQALSQLAHKTQRQSRTS